MHVSTAVDPKLDIGRRRSFIASTDLVFQDQNNSLQRKANSQFTSKQFAWRASACCQTSDREKLIAKKKSLLVPDYRS